MKFVVATLFTLMFPMPTLAAGTPEEEAQYAIWEADFAELERCVQGASAETIAVDCVIFTADNCYERRTDKSRAASIGCYAYERDLWKLAYTRLLGRTVGAFSNITPTDFLFWKSRKDDAKIFMENEVLWRRSMEAECEFYQHQNGSMAGGFRNLHCQMTKYENRIKYLNGLDSLGKR
jgi:hypothetical protein